MDQRRLQKLEEGLLQALQALDRQVARELQRSPAELEAHGVLKWEPYQKRIELVCSFILDSLGGREVELDSLIILAQALSKALRLVIDDLGEDGLGQVRSSYCLVALEKIAADAHAGKQALRSERTIT